MVQWREDGDKTWVLTEAVQFVVHGVGHSDDDEEQEKSNDYDGGDGGTTHGICVDQTKIWLAKIE